MYVDLEVAPNTDLADGNHLKTIIEDRWDFETAAFRSRAKKILKQLS